MDRFLRPPIHIVALFVLLIADILGFVFSLNPGLLPIMIAATAMSAVFWLMMYVDAKTRGGFVCKDLDCRQKYSWLVAANYCLIIPGLFADWKWPNLIGAHPPGGLVVLIQLLMIIATIALAPLVPEHDGEEPQQ